MRQFAMKITSKGQVTLPAEYRRLVGAKAGDRLILALDDQGAATLRKSNDTLAGLKAIGRRARRNSGSAGRTSADPIGDYLLAEDDRTRGLRK